MRDDLSGLFNQLTDLYNKKLNILKEISSNETQLRFFLQSDKIPELSELIQLDNHLFTTIDSINFCINSIITEICRISGIEKNNFNNYFLHRNEDPIPELKKLKEQTNILISELIKERDMLVVKMEKKSAELKEDINALNIIQKIDLDKMH